MTSDEQGDMVLHGTHAQVIDRQVVITTVRTDRAFVEQRPDGPQALPEALHPRTRRPHLDVRRPVLVLRVSRTHAENEASTGQTIDGGCGARQQGWMVELVVQYEGPHAQVGCGCCRDHERCERIDGPEVVVGEQLDIAELLDAAGKRSELLSIGKIPRLHCEPEWSRHLRSLQMQRRPQAATSEWSDIPQ